MLIERVILKLRASTHTNAVFGDRVTGVADVSRAVTYTALAYPAAYVTLLSDDAERQAPGSNENWQRCTTHIGVIVGLEATNDIRAQEPMHQIDEIRVRLFRALYNWAPNFAQNPSAPLDKPYGNFWYGGCKLLELSRAATFWLFTFSTYWVICGAEGEGEDDQFLPPNVGHLERVRIHEDWIDPHDPGEFPSGEYTPPIGPSRGPPPWPTGPEGRIEKEHHVDFPPQIWPRGYSNGGSTH